MSRDPFSFESPERGDREKCSPEARQNSRSSGEERPRPALLDEAAREDLSHRPRMHERKPEAQDSPRAYYLGKRTYFVRDSELTTLTEVGTFRVVSASDLARFGYTGDADRMNREIGRLRQQGLLSEKPITGKAGQQARFLSLTKRGKQLLVKSGRVAEGQTVYHGLVKPREAKHDAALYQLFEQAAARLEREGARPTRVMLDYELKRELHRDLAELGEEGQAPDVRERVAGMHGLTIVNGRIQVPDLRVEYVTPDLDRRQIDLELATRNYRPRALAEKAKAGFSLYAPREDASRLRRVLDENEITARILSL